MKNEPSVGLPRQSDITHRDFFGFNAFLSKKHAKINSTYYSDWGMAPKNDPQLGNRHFFLSGQNGKVVAPSILVICPVDKNRDSKTKN